jgi:hypothetical protein
MFAHAVQHAKLRLDEAYSIYKTMLAESRNKVTILWMLGPISILMRNRALLTCDHVIAAPPLLLSNTTPFSSVTVCHTSPPPLTQVKCTLNLLPQVIDPDEAKQLVKKICRGDRTALLQIKQQLGMCQRPMFGHYNGYYTLDLSKPFDRMCLSILMEKSRTASGKRAAER